MRHVYPGTAQFQFVGITFLIGISPGKTVEFFAILAMRLIPSYIDFVMLNFSFKFHTVLQAFNKQKFLMLMFLCLRKSTRYLFFPLAKTVLELNFSTMDTSCWSAM